MKHTEQQKRQQEHQEDLRCSGGEPQTALGLHAAAATSPDSHTGPLERYATAAMNERAELAPSVHA